MTNPNNLAVGEYRKAESNKETCEVCGNECPLLFQVMNEDVQKMENRCEGCWNRYYIDHPVTR